MRLNDPQQPFHVLGGIAFQHILWDEITVSVNRCCQKYFPEWGIDPMVEIHAKEIWNRCGAFKHTTPAQRLVFFDELLESVFAIGEVTYLWGAADKQKLSNYKKPFSPIDVSAWMLTERIAEFCHVQAKKAVVIMDENLFSEQKIKDYVVEYRKHGPMVGHHRADLSCIYDNVHFIDSDSSRHIQVSDVLNYIMVRKLKNTPDQYGFNALFRHVDHAIGKVFPC